MTFGDEVYVLSFVNASGVLVNAKYSKGCRAGAL
jgi:hypothetical protein